MKSKCFKNLSGFARSEPPTMRLTILHTTEQNLHGALLTCLIFHQRMNPLLHKSITIEWSCLKNGSRPNVPAVCIALRDCSQPGLQHPCRSLPHSIGPSSPTRCPGIHHVYSFMVVINTVMLSESQQASFASQNAFRRQTVFRVPPPDCQLVRYD